MKKHTYKVTGAGLDAVSGWYKWTLLRDDGREVKVPKLRLQQLRAEGRIVEAVNG